MPVKSYVLGPGTLELGTDPTDLDVSAQVRSMLVRAAERVTRVEPIPVLSGEELAGAETVEHDFTLVGNVIQDPEVGGMVDFTWENRGLPVACRFVPSTAAGRVVTGTVVPIPLDFGGDVDRVNRPEAAITWRFTTDPDLGELAP
jgi:hypothetical protein